MFLNFNFISACCIRHAYFTKKAKENSFILENKITCHTQIMWCLCYFNNREKGLTLNWNPLELSWDVRRNNLKCFRFIDNFSIHEWRHSADSNTLMPTAATNAWCCLKLLKESLSINGSVFTTAVVSLNIPESGLFEEDFVKVLKCDTCFYGKDKMRRKHEPIHQFE